MIETDGVTYIDQRRIRRQAWKFYACLLAWPLYLFLIPYAFHLLRWWSLFFMIFPGAWLFSWVAYLMHESWHKYVPGIPSDLFYYLFGYADYRPTGLPSGAWLKRFYWHDAQGGDAANASCLACTAGPGLFPAVPRPGTPPQDAVFITLRNYLKIAWGMITEG